MRGERGGQERRGSGASERLKPCCVYGARDGAVRERGHHRQAHEAEDQCGRTARCVRCVRGPRRGASSRAEQQEAVRRLGRGGSRDHRQLSLTAAHRLPLALFLSPAAALNSTTSVFPHTAFVHRSRVDSRQPHHGRLRHRTRCRPGLASASTSHTAKGADVHHSTTCTQDRLYSPLLLSCHLQHQTLRHGVLLCSPRCQRIRHVHHTAVRLEDAVHRPRLVESR